MVTDFSPAFFAGDVCFEVVPPAVFDAALVVNFAFEAVSPPAEVFAPVFISDFFESAFFVARDFVTDLEDFVAEVDVDFAMAVLILQMLKCRVGGARYEGSSLEVLERKA